MKISTERKIVDGLFAIGVICCGVAWLVRAFGHRDDMVEAILDAVNEPAVVERQPPASAESTEVH